MIKKVIKDLCPPIILNVLKGSKDRGPEFSGVYNSFSDVPKMKSNVWESEIWIKQQQKKINGYIKREESNDPNRFVSFTAFGAGNGVLLNSINSLSANKEIKVLDFGGGTGLQYFSLKNLFLHPENVKWIVVDSKRLADLSQDLHDENISFSEEIVDDEVDILFISSTLHYIDSYKKLLTVLLEKRPKFVQLERLHAGSIEKPFVTMQDVGSFESRTPIWCASVDEIVNIFTEHNYELMIKFPIESETYPESSYSSDVPKELQIPYSLGLAFNLKE